ncbi:hypothetical protein ABTC85_15765 [Acinetobacter baumannii]|uniref:Uncharacterized protein n=1 Tax=Acinetobacter baumannii TaxID=470 RepID=A0A0C4Y2P8_ACIBA|nr:MULTISPECIES: hypothetical protein [Acinetobacter calcoaceticus/baumannii complex]AFI97451.1 hypothetical protein ABTJ_p0073 [Acinetobacter baumannii MDR-TJ]AGQ12343.1 hypothetical protein BJAB0868_p0086 [Acinetobacter baumannii BJAB0868]AGQ16204.1 hypothetical protein BJAB07104_p0076 [Acinetobacter baumannii BJAB07104]AJF79921.1 hypothetical protein NG19_0085 [Acinetobacter baumannii]APF45755.1 hypothetical protein BKJ37_19675 [Acinetobacter baumannii]
MSLGTSMTEIKALFQKFTNSTLNDEEKIYLNTTDKKVIFTASKIITLQISKNRIAYTEYDISNKEKMRIVAKETLSFSTSLSFLVKFHFAKVHAETIIQAAQ